MKPGKKFTVRLTRLALVLGIALGLGAGASRAADLEAAREKGRAGRCFDCHGEDGVAGSSGYPNLGGQHRTYLLKQLADFRSGARKSPFMNIVASNLDERDGAEIAAYFAALPRNREESADAGAGPGLAAAARKLYQEGDATRALVPCASCHGAAGAGTADGLVPAVGGQQMYYLREQLLNWQLGQRSNSPARSMNQAASPLTEAEIDALARYMAGM